MDRWLFIHVMKTAGTSFRQMLEAALGDALYPTRAEMAAQPNGWYLRAPELLARIAEGRLDLGRRRVVSGHYAVRLRDELPGRWRTVIFLREPVARTLSMIAHRKRHRGFFERHGAPNVAAYLREDAFVRNQIENYQTKILAMAGSGNVNQPYPVDETAFARAVETLLSVDCVGLTDRFQDSVAAFERLSGIRFAGEPRHANRGGRDHGASEADLAAIRALVSYDLRLYEIARARLRAQLEAAPATPNAALATADAR
jgi:hypothetical protein